MKYIFCLLLFAIATAGYAQKHKPEYYIYDKDWKAAKEVASAEYVVQTVSIGDSLFVNRIFKGTGYLWRQESFSDAAQTMPHGQFAWYDSEGRIDSSGYVNKKKKTGNWSYFDDTLGTYLSVKYEDGKEVERTDYVKKVIKSAAGEKTFDEQKREDSVLRSSFTAPDDEKEAVFKGGPTGYRKYLEKKLVVPNNLTRTGSVKVEFIINKSGKMENLMLRKSVQMSADIEAIRVLSEMPDWTPAFQNGKNVYYHCMQSITFQAG